jgi:hypothetical protein
MVTQRIVSPNYLGIGLAVATGLAANLGSPHRAQAQVDPNIQTQLNILLPPISVQTPSSGVATEPGQTFIQTATVSGCAPTAKLRTFAAKLKLLTLNELTEKGVRAPAEREIAQSLTEQEIKQIVEDYFNKQSNLTNTQKIETEKFIAPVRLDPCATQQPVKAQISFPFNPSYETNILKTGNNSSPGESAGFGGNVLVSAGVERRPWDVVVFSGGEASSRYIPKSSPSVDGLSSQAAYQMFLHAYGYNPTTGMVMDNLVPGAQNMPPAGMMTFDTLAFGVQNQTAFAPTFKTEKSDFLTPQVTLARQNIGFDKADTKPCYDLSGNQQYCYYANLSFTAGQSYSDIRPLENANFAASASLGWNITENWGLALPATATAKDYEHVVGGRRDLLLQIGPVLTYSGKSFPLCTAEQIKKNIPLCAEEKASFKFSLPISYFKNYSTIAADAWSGWVIMPTLTIAFNP